MSFSRFALGFTRNRKVFQLSDAAFRLYVSAIDWSREQLTDGAIQAIDIDAMPRVPRGGKREAIVAELVALNLWERTETGWQIHEFHVWQETAETTRRKQESARERMRKLRGDGSPDVRANTERTSGEVRHGSGSGSGSGEKRSEEPPVVPPVGDRPPRGDRQKAPRVAKWARFPRDWVISEGCVQLARELGISVKTEHAKILDHEFKTPRSDPEATFRTWLRRSAEMAQERRPPGAVQHTENRVEQARLQRVLEERRRQRAEGGNA